MSTKIAHAERPITEFALPSWKTVAGTLAPIGTNITGQTAWGLSDATPQAAIYCRSEKAVEAQRQIDRVRSLSVLCKTSSGQDDKQQLESIASSVALIGSFLLSPMPIPIASSGSDNRTTLFFQDENFYGDLEINRNEIEYFLKRKTNEGPIEIYDCEEIEDGKVPPRLLMFLFSHYAR